MKTSRILVICLISALVLIEGYLIISSYAEKREEGNKIQIFCQAKCKYNPGSFLWEFSGDTYVKGFTTREECFNHCSKVKQGFVASILNGLVNLIKR